MEQSSELAPDAFAAVRQVWLHVLRMSLACCVPAGLAWGVMAINGAARWMRADTLDPVGLDTAMLGVGMTLFLGSEFSRIPSYRRDPHSAARAQALSTITLATASVMSILAWLTVPLLASSALGLLTGSGAGLLLSILAGLVRPESDEFRSAKAQHEVSKVQAAIARLTAPGKPIATRRRAYPVILAPGVLFAIWPAAIPVYMAAASWSVFAADPAKPLGAWATLALFGTITYGWLVSASYDWEYGKDSNRPLLMRIADVGLITAVVILMNLSVLIGLAIRGGAVPLALGLVILGTPMVAATLVARSRYSRALLRHRLLVRACELGRRWRDAPLASSSR